MPTATNPVPARRYDSHRRFDAAVSIRVTREQLARLDGLADRLGRNRNSLARDAIDLLLRFHGEVAQ